MREQTEQVRHEVLRGLILRILVLRDLDWVSFIELKLQLVRGQGQTLRDDDSLMFQLRYLSDRGYVELKRLRAGRADIELQCIRATGRAVDYLDGRLPDDPGIVK